MSVLRSCKWPAVGILWLSLAGCADSVSPTGGSGDSRAYYPLTVGNNWVYAGRLLVTVDSLGVRSSRAYAPVLEIEMLSDSALSMGQYYSREGSRSGTAEFMPQTYYVNLMRQDSKGLYQAIPVGYLGTGDRQGAGTADGPGIDATRLVFPLRVGVTWVNQNGLDARVEALDFVSVPAGHFAAWRIALGHSSPYGKVVVRDWYGDVGLVKSTLHLETQGEVRDSAGAVVGQKYVIEDYVYVLKSFVLEGPPGRLLPAVVALR